MKDKSPPCVKEGGTQSVTGGLSNNPSVSKADSSPYTGEPLLETTNDPLCHSEA